MKPQDHQTERSERGRPEERRTEHRELRLSLWKTVTSKGGRDALQLFACQRVKDSGAISASPAALMSGRQSNAAQSWQESMGSYSSVRMGIWGPGPELSGWSTFTTSCMPSTPTNVGFFNIPSIERQGEPDPAHIKDFCEKCESEQLWWCIIGEKAASCWSVLHSLQKGSAHRHSFDGRMFGAQTKAPFLLLSNCPSWSALRWTCCKFQLHHEHSGKGGSKSAPQALIYMMVHLVCVTIYKKGTALSMLDRWRQTRSSSNITWSTNHLTPAQLASTCAPASSSAAAARTFLGVPRLYSFEEKAPGGERGSCSIVIPTKGWPAGSGRDEHNCAETRFLLPHHSVNLTSDALIAFFPDTRPNLKKRELLLCAFSTMLRQKDQLSHKAFVFLRYEMKHHLAKDLRPLSDLLSAMKFSKKK